MWNCGICVFHVNGQVCSHRQSESKSSISFPSLQEVKLVHTTRLLIARSAHYKKCLDIIYILFYPPTLFVLTVFQFSHDILVEFHLLPKINCDLFVYDF